MGLRDKSEQTGCSNVALGVSRFLDLGLLLLRPLHFRAAVIIFSIISRTDLRISVSRAKFDGESDFEVRLAVARQKPDQNNEKLILRSKIFVEQICSTSKNEMWGIV